ncbi:phosphopantetheine-binding protein [Streptomyces lydicus]
MEGPLDLRTVVVTALKSVMSEPPIDDDSASLPAQGLTSVETLSVVVTVEDELGIAIPDELLAPANFSSVGRIVALLEPLVADTA